MSLSRDILRSQAKKIYKEQAKSVPKKQRLPFSKFYKQFVKMQRNPVEQEEVATAPTPATEDFDFQDMVNVNAVSDDKLKFDTDPNAEATEQSSEEDK
jgi:hypothetical protein